MKALVAVEVGVEILLEKMIIKGSTFISYRRPRRSRRSLSGTCKRVLRQIEGSALGKH